MAGVIATIVHLTDMHLFVDAGGETRNDALPTARLLTWIAKKAPLASVQRLGSGAMWHNEEALLALRDALGELAHASSPGAPLVVVQGGDVEALGSALEGAVGYDAFPSWAYLHGVLRPLGGWSWSDIYGNHDTWPGSYPPLRARDRALNRSRIASIPGLAGPWPDALKIASPQTGVPVVIARLNTVSRTLLCETLASGNVSDHPPGNASLQEVLDALGRALEPWADRPAVRIVSMHHPVHVAGASGRRLTSGWLEAGDELAECLRRLRVQLVIAGHTHELDPERDASYVPLGLQPPLAAPTAQLVAESPTQDSVDELRSTGQYEGMESRSFSLYQLIAEGESFAVERTIFSYADQRGEYAGEGPVTVFSDLPLE